MLTKGEVLHKMQGFECPKYLMESCWQPIYDQAVAAIDLAAENERLKAKLDAVREECYAERCRTWTIHRGYQTMVEAVDILAIIDKDGDTDD